MKTPLKILIVLSVIFIIGSFVSVMIRSNNETAYDCKVLATYHDAAGYKVSAKYTAVVRIIELKTNTSINLSPDGFYNAEQYAKSGKTIGYYFSDTEIDRALGTNKFNFGLMLFIGLCVFAASAMTYVFKYVE